MDDVDARLSRAHPGQTGVPPIGELLTVVIVLLLQMHRVVKMMSMSMIWWMSWK